jgi:sodium/bile acid cotransporter 7
MAINMVMVLTRTSGGNEPSAVFNSAAGNLLGVVLSPLLVLGYIGLSANVDVGDVFFKLAIRILLPIAFGQILRKCVPCTVKFYTNYKKAFTRAQQYALVFLVYTVFCETFTNDNNIPGVYIVTMIAAVFGCLVGLMIGAWVMLRLLFRDRPDLCVMGLFGCTQKTVAMGIPMINALYADDPTIGLVTLPLLIWHPMQLIIGSYLSPKLLAWVKAEEKRLGINQDGDEHDEQDAAENGGVGANSDDPSNVPPSKGQPDDDDERTNKNLPLTQQNTSINDDESTTGAAMKMAEVEVEEV